MAICFSLKYGNKSLDAGYLIYLFFVMCMAILLQILSYKLIDQINKIITQKAVIDDLTSQTQTASVISSLDSAYATQK